jgi:hypothetical protein
LFGALQVQEALLTPDVFFEDALALRAAYGECASGRHKCKDEEGYGRSESEALRGWCGQRFY